MADYDMSIHTNPDARAWARLYVETKAKSADPADFDDEENMLGWFANAMMAMHDHLTGQGVTVLDDGSAFFVANVTPKSDPTAVPSTDDVVEELKQQYQKTTFHHSV